MASFVGLRWRAVPALAATLVAAVVMTGCGFTPSVVTSGGSLNMQGSVMGGQQPIVNAHVQLFVAGTGGNGAAATNLMGTGSNGPVAYATTDSNGKFSLSGDFTCPAASAGYVPQAYVVATGGNPGLATAPTNLSLIHI